MIIKIEIQIIHFILQAQINVYMQKVDMQLAAHKT